jgi:hypothetical protein
MTQSMTFGGGNLPAKAQSLQAALANVERDLLTGVTTLKFAKGDWLQGTVNEDVDPKSKWMVDPYSFEHGYIAWGGGKPVDEIMVSMLSALPDPGPAPAESLAPDKEGKPGRGWQRQSGLRLKCVEGPEKGIICRFTTSSDGGRRAVKKLSDAISEQLGVDSVNFCPIVCLEVDSYQHKDKDRGRIKVPVFKILSWVPELGVAAEPEPFDGEEDEEDKYENYDPEETDGAPWDEEEEEKTIEPEPAPEPAPRTRRSAPTPAPEPAPAQTERRRRR